MTVSDWCAPTNLPAVRLRFLLQPGPGERMPNAGEFRGTLGHVFLESKHAEALQCFFPSARDSEPQEGFGFATPWALHMCDNGCLEVGLFADAVPLMAVWVEAALRVCERQVGRCLSLKLAGFEHEAVLGSGVWSSGLPRALGTWDIAPAPTAPIQLHFESPLRLRVRGKDLRPRDLHLRAIVASLMRRITGLCRQSGINEPAWNARALLDSIDDSPFDTSRLQAARVDRYSQLQLQKMSFIGTLGAVTLTPEQVAPAWPLLWMGQVLHVGKTPCLGMGRLRLEPCR